MHKLAGLSPRPVRWHNYIMKRFAFLPLLVAFLAIASLALAPVATMARTNAIAPSAMQAAMDDMSCCPDMAIPDCGKSCPLMVVCMGTTLPPAPAIFASVALSDIGSDLDSADDARIAGLDPNPPRKPPRI